MISFHSLEDRIVKRFMRKMSGRPTDRNDSSFVQDRVSLAEMIQAKAIFPTKSEVDENPRSRSARLRVLRKLCKSRAMIRRRMFLILLLVSFFGAGSIGIVWLRMDISRVAKKCGQLETDREVVSRELYELRGQKSRSLRPST